MGGSGVQYLLAAAGFAGLVSGATAQPAQPMPRHIGPVALDAPSADIGNGLIEAKIYLTDSKNGFYRGTRFDQSGVIGSLRLGGRNFYGPWFDHTSPEVRDFIVTPEGIVAGPDSAIAGPVEEFAPVGFDEAPPGGTFLKIGVGVLKRPDAQPYDHYHPYEILNSGKRSVQAARSRVTFTQDIAGAFHYVKILRLVPGKPQMRIEHVLTNIGAKPFATSVYDHNFLTLNPGNANIAVTLPFPIAADHAPDPELARIDANRVAYVRPLKDKEVVSFHISGFGGTKQDYDIKVDDTGTGAEVRITADQPLIKMNFWSIRSVMAIEPYIGIELAPGATKRWIYTYTYKAPAR